MNPLPLFVDAMETAVSRRVAAGDVVTVVRKLLAGSDPRCFSNDLVAFNDQTRAIRVNHYPFTSEQRHRPIGRVMNCNEINERVGLVGRQTRAAVMITQLVQGSREARQFARARHIMKESRDPAGSKRHVGEPLRKDQIVLAIAGPVCRTGFTPRYCDADRP